MGQVFRYRIHLVFTADGMKKPESYRTDIICGTPDTNLIRSYGVSMLKAQALGLLTGVKVVSLSMDRQEF